MKKAMQKGDAKGSGTAVKMQHLQDLMHGALLEEPGELRRVADLQTLWNQPGGRLS